MISSRRVDHQSLVVLLVTLLALTLCAIPGPWGGARQARAADPSAVPNLGNWTTDGYVTAIDSDGDTTYLGGTFSYVGPNTGFGVPLDTSSGLPQAVYPEVIGKVQVVIPDGSGGWFIGGGFYYVGGTPVNRLAHINPDGTLDSAFKPNVNNTVYALTLAGDGNTLYIGGIFSSIQGTSGGPYNYANLAAVDSDPASPGYGNPLPWTPGVNGGVMALALTGDGNTLYVGGGFSSITGTSAGPYPRNCIAAIDTASANPTTWNPNANNSVAALVLSGSTLYAAGSFTQIQGGSSGPYPRNYLAAIDTTTANPTAFNPGMNNTVPALALSADGNTLYAGGNFGTIQGNSGGPYTRHYLAAVDSDPASPGYGNPTAWNPDMNSSVYSLALHGSTLYAGGFFDTIQGASGGPYTRRYFAAIDTFNANPTGLAAYANSLVWALAPSGDGSTVYVGGDLTSIGGALRTNLAAVDAATGLPTDWSPAPDGGVNDLVLHGSTIYAGGAFNNIQGHTGGPYARNRIAAIGVDPASPGYGNPTGFNPGADNTVSALALSGDGNTLYAGGAFNNIQGASGPYARYFIAAIDTASSNPTTWRPSMDGIVLDLLLNGSTLYAGGNFLNIQGTSGSVFARNYLAAISTVNGDPSGWDPKPNSIVCDMALSGSILYIGGYFTTVQGSSGGPYLRNRLAAVDTATGNPDAFDPDADNNVLAVALSDDGSTLYAGGGFNRLKVSSGTPYTRNFIAAVDADPASPAYGDPTTWNPNMNNSVTDLEVSGSTLYAGGNFWVIGSRICTGFAAFDGVPSVSSITPSAGENDGTVSVTDLAGSDFRAGATVLLRRTGQADIAATNVTVVSASKITCDFDLDMAAAGAWDVVVTNPDAQANTLAGGFTVNQATRTITASAGAHGTITPSGAVGVNYGGSQAFTITPSAGYHVADVKVDGSSVGAVTSYTFSNVTSNHTIAATFAINAYTITASAGAGGSIAPSGAVSVNHGADKAFTITPSAGYHVADVKVDGSSVGAVTNYTFTGVTADHTIAATFASDLSVWYLAEGSTDHGFECYISIENPNAQAVRVKLTYMLGSGPVAGPTITMPALSQATVYPSSTLGPADFSTRVECLEGKTIAVDRTMYWTGAGAPCAEAHCASGVTSAAATWYMPEGSSAHGFECFLLIQNPNAAAAACAITWMIEGADPVTTNVSVPASSRATYNMADWIGAADASIKVEANAPVICERAMYRYDRRGGHDSTGTTVAASDYYLAEGCTGYGFTTFILVQNPQGAPTDVTITYQAASGPVAGPSFQMPANSRKTVNVNLTTEIPGPDPSFSTHVHGSAPIIAERAMYWDNGTGEACHDSIGLDAPHTAWFLADGQTSEGRETFTLVQNPNAEDVQVEITYMTPDGTGNVVRDETIPANSRRTFNMADHSGINGRAAIRVTCGFGKKVMVERAMYWNFRGTGTDTIGGYSD